MSEQVEQPGKEPKRSSKTRLGLIALGVVVVLAIVLMVVFQPQIQRLRFAMTMFSGAEMVESFRTLPDVFPSTTVKASGEPSELTAGEPITLPATYEFKGQERSVETLLEETDTTGLIVIKDDVVVFEEQFRGNVPTTQTISWSMAKSFVSALVGIAVDEGAIESIEQPITQYVPELEGSAYDGVPIKDVLQMSSGARWNEDYNDWNSDINKFGRILALGGSFDSFTATLTREFDPGTFNRYNSMDTQALAMMLVRATGKSLTTYLEEKIWVPLGMEADAYWLTDNEAMEMAFGGLNATLRDYARFGLLYLHEGRVGEKQVVPEEWVKASVTADAPHLQPGKDNPQSDFPLGYGLQWWITDGDEGEFSAIGIYNQFIYVNPTRSLVIAKTSAFSDYATTKDESSYRELETIEMFRAIGRMLSGGQAEAAEPETTESEEQVTAPATDEAAPQTDRTVFQQRDIPAGVPLEGRAAGETKYGYRIPSLLVTQRGSILAFSERRLGLHDHAQNDIVLRRSTDGGQTWSDEIVAFEDGLNSINDPLTVQLENGRILLMFARFPYGRHARDAGWIKMADLGYDDPQTNVLTFICHSDDDGQSWSEPVDISRQVKSPHLLNANTPGAMIQLSRGPHAGRVVTGLWGSLPTMKDGKRTREWQIVVAYSDDNGQSWNRTEPLRDDSGAGFPNECQVAEAANGDIVLVSRNERGEKFRKKAISSDGGATWSPLNIDRGLPSVACMGSLIKGPVHEDGGWDLWASFPSNMGRKDGQIAVSQDNGRTWQIVKVIHGPFAYSALQVSPDRSSLLCLYESDDYRTQTLTSMPFDRLLSSTSAE